ncbi:MAG: DinB family protein [Brumimicrobium sp.]
MINKTEEFITIWKEARTRFSNQMENLSEADMSKTLGEKSNSIGFLMRHIGDVELLFAKNVFGNKDVKVKAETVIDGEDTGKWTDADELLQYIKDSYSQLLATLENVSEDEWEEEVETKEFGKKSKAEAFARVVSHTAYHAGQIAIINKYSNK